MKKFFVIILCLCLLLCGCYSVPDSPQKEVFPQTVVYEDSDFRITATDLQYNRGNIEIDVLVENNTQENATVYCDSFIINNVMVTALMLVDVASEAKANGTIYIDKDVLQSAGIEQINTLTSYGAHISFDVRDTLEIEFSITDNADYIQAIDESGNVLYSENGITVISKFEPGKYSDKIPLLLKNESGQDLHIFTSHVTVNGYTVPEVHYYSPICNGTYRFFEIELSSWGQEEMDVIESASFSIEFMKPKSTQVIFKTGNLGV